jgi:hypothetical protein
MFSLVYGHESPTAEVQIYVTLEDLVFSHGLEHREVVPTKASFVSKAQEELRFESL